MSQINAITLSEAICNRMVSFALDDHFVRDDVLREVLKTIWEGPPEKGGLTSELWVEGAFPSQSGEHTLHQLAGEHILPQVLVDHLDDRGVFPQDRRLYTHQV